MSSEWKAWDRKGAAALQLEDSIRPGPGHYAGYYGENHTWDSVPPESLATAIRVRVGADADANIWLQTTSEYGQYSSWTDWTSVQVRVLVDGVEVWEFSDASSDTWALAQLLDWLDGDPEVRLDTRRST